MTKDNVMKCLNNIKPGTFTRITFVTELPLKAEFKNRGFRVTKTTSITTRFGIHYGNIKGVEINNTTKDKKVNNFYWVDNFKKNLCYNTNTKKYYICTYPTKKGTNINTKYSIKYPDGSFKGNLTSIDKNMVINSYWNKSSTKMMRINIDNVLKIGS